jgi:hypothetical protein
MRQPLKMLLTITVSPSPETASTSRDAALPTVSTGLIGRFAVR